jgi:hypothetical protein
MLYYTHHRCMLSALCHHHIPWCSPIHATLTLQTCVLFKEGKYEGGFVSCNNRSMHWAQHQNSSLHNLQIVEFGIPSLHALVKREQSLKLQAWRTVMVQTWSQYLQYSFFNNHMKFGDVLVLHPDSCRERLQSTNTPPWLKLLKCRHRQDIEQFPYHIHNHLQVNFVIGHRCPPQCSSVQRLCYMHHQNWGCGNTCQIVNNCFWITYRNKLKLQRYQLK